MPHFNSAIELPPCGVFFGSGVYYSRSGYLSLSGPAFTTWWSQDDSPLEVLDKVIKDNQGNLVQLWGFSGGVSLGADQAPIVYGQYHALEDVGVEVPLPDWENRRNLTMAEWPEAEDYTDRQGAGAVKFVRAASELGLYTMLIYTEAAPEWSQRLTESGKHYLGYDFGETFSFRFPEERRTRDEPEEIVTLNLLADQFVKRVREHVEARRRNGWGRIVATSANFHLDYEVAAGVDIPLAEDFAFSHLNMASALSRGLYKQYKLPLWGGHLAHEHYSWIPYKSPHKFDLLRSAFQQKLMAGCKIIINESGNWAQQARLCADAPMNDLPSVDLGQVHRVDPYLVAPFVRSAERMYERINYDSDVCRSYRKVTSDFYDFLKEGGASEGQPEVTIAIAKGNLDLCGHEYNPNVAIAGMYSQADSDPRWFENSPEKGWQIVKDVFYPRPPVLDPYPNHFLSGTPYGMVDLVSFADGNITAEFLSANYRAVLFSGWNTASEKQYQVLDDYVLNGGVLFISIPHLSRNVTRNYGSYSVDELIAGGDFSQLCGVRVRKKGRRFYWATAAPDFSGELGFEFPRRYGIMATCLGDIEIVDPLVEALVVDDEGMEPVLLRRSHGRGSVYFLNSWAYPGALNADIGPGAHSRSLGLIGAIYEHIAKQVRGQVWITPNEMATCDDGKFIAYSYFPAAERIYLQNVDYVSPHGGRLHYRELVQEFELAPGEFRVIDATNCSGNDFAT